MYKPFNHVFSRSESTDRPSEFFVETATPKHFESDSEEDNSARLRRAVTMGDPNAQVDFLVTPTPEIDLRLLSKKLTIYVALAVAFYAAFTVVFFIGVKVDTVYEAIGTSKKAEDLVETYNTYSGYAMAMVEVFVAMHTDKFMPVLEVYVHNSLFFLQRGSDGKTKSKSSRRLHTVLLFLFPIVLGLTMGNSLRGLQASQSSNGFKRIMSVDDMKKEQPMLELIKAKAKKNATTTTTTAALSTEALRGVNDIILKNAIRQQTTPFTFDTKSACGLKPNATDGEDKDVADLVNSALSSQKASRTVKLNTHELDSTSVVYGFVPQEWNSEAITTELTPKSNYTITYQQVLDARKKSQKIPQPTDFSLETAFEMFVQAKILIERAHGDAAIKTYACSLSDGRTDLDEDYSEDLDSSDSGSKAAEVGKSATKVASTKSFSLGAHMHRVAKRRLQETNASASASEDYDDFEEDPPSPWVRDENGTRQCEGAVTSLFNMSSFVNRTTFTAEDLVVEATAAIHTTMTAISTSETEITLEKYDLTPQIHIEAMRMDISMNNSIYYGLETQCEPEDKKCEPLYEYDSVQESFCGSNGCAFVDTSNTFTLQREIGVVPYVVNCSLNADHVHYSTDFRGFYPNDCKKVPNTALLYGFGSYISGDEYGGNDTRHGSGAPYILNPRRRLRFTVAKVTWKTESLAATFNATCGINKGNANCTGLWYQLQPSGRFLFAGEDALTTKKFAKADFRTPIPLVQLNSPTLYVDQIKGQATLERIAPKYFTKTVWKGKPENNGSALGGDDCSMLMDSYLKQVDDNNYFLERPLQAMYTSFFYYFMENAAVTQLNDTSIALNGTNLTATTKALKNDKLGNVKLKGDKQVRSIRVSIPTSSFYTTLGGCVSILLMTLIILVVPARRVEYFDEDTTKAQQFIVMREDETYPSSVLSKTLLFPVTNESVPFDDVEIERVALVHASERDRMVYL